MWISPFISFGLFSKKFFLSTLYNSFNEVKSVCMLGFFFYKDESFYCEKNLTSLMFAPCRDLDKFISSRVQVLRVANYVFPNIVLVHLLERNKRMFEILEESLHEVWGVNLVLPSGFQTTKSSNLLCIWYYLTLKYCLVVSSLCKENKGKLPISLGYILARIQY